MAFRKNRQPDRRVKAAPESGEKEGEREKERERGSCKRERATSSNSHDFTPTLSPLPPNTLTLATQHSHPCHPALSPLPPSTLTLATQHSHPCHPALSPLPPNTLTLATQRCLCVCALLLRDYECL